MRVVATSVLAVLVLATAVFARSSPASAAPSWQFSTYAGVGNLAGISAVSALVKGPIGFGSDCFDMRSWKGIQADQWLIDQMAPLGKPMVWGVPMLPAKRGVSLARGAKGSYNRHFATLAANLVAAGMGNSTLRLGWEFNMPSFPWYAAGQASNFTAYWQQIVNTMRSVPGAAFKFEWNPTRGGQGAVDQAMGNYANYYPGDAYVDVVALDVYDSAYYSYPGAAQEFANVQTLPWGLDWISAFATAHRKTISLAELGLGTGTSAPGSGPVTGSGALSGGDDPVFMSDVLSWATANHVASVVYWDYGASSIEKGMNPLTATALRQALAG